MTLKVGTRLVDDEGLVWTVVGEGTEIAKSLRRNIDAWNTAETVTLAVTKRNQLETES